MKKLIIVVAALGLTLGCSMADPFKRSNESMMAAVVQQLPLGDMLEKFFAAASGKKVIFVNMESDEYTDDQLPEYLFLDAMYSRLTASNVKVQLLERDPDTLTLLEKEMEGVTLPATEKPCGKSSPCESEAKSAADIQADRDTVAKLLREVLDEISGQEVLVTMDAACCGGKGQASKVTSEMVANEVGDNKSKLIKDLVTRYTALYDTGGKAETFRREIEVDQADYIFAYRLYEYGWHKNKGRRITYIKLHYRIIGLDTGRVLLSDFLEHRIDEILTPSENRLMNTKGKNADFRRPGKRNSNSGKR